MTTDDKHSTRNRRPAGITCPHYKAIPGRKHCQHYLDNGACSRPDEFMCREWMKANGHLIDELTRKPSAAARDTRSSLQQGLASSPVDLFGNPNPDYRPTPRDCNDTPVPSVSVRQDKPRQTRGQQEREAWVPPAASDNVADDREWSSFRGLTTEDIDSFKALGVEVCMRSDTFGEVWLVPEYTCKDRKEITPEHTATICRVMEAFHGSRVVSFEKTHEIEEEI